MRSAKFAVAFLFLTFTYAAFGQTGGTITGLITDPAGAVVANAPVEAKNTATGVVLSAASSATGNYVLPALAAGTYEINANVPGFKKYTQTGVEVQQLQTTRVDISLTIGSATESVTVSESAPLLKTETGDVSHNVTTDRLDELPMGQIGSVRNTTQVILTIPGVNGGLTSMSINGSPAPAPGSGSTAWMQPTPWATPTTRSERRAWIRSRRLRYKPVTMRQNTANLLAPF